MDELSSTQSTAPGSGAENDPRKWVRIVCLVIRQINSGELTAGSRVTIDSLCRQCGEITARQTAAKALQFLEAEGIFQRYFRTGYVVRAGIRVPLEIPDTGRGHGRP